MKIYKFLIAFIFLLLSTIELKAQTFLYTYTDPCTGLLKSLTVPSNGVTVTYFNQIQTFSPQDFQNGVFDTWATGVLNSYGNANPCGSVLGVSTSVDVAQGSAMSFISIINNLTAVSELQSAMGGGSLNTMSVIESAKSSSGGKKDKKDKGNDNSNQNTTTTTTTTQGSNQSGVSSESNQNSQTNSETQNGQSSQSENNNQTTTSNQSGQSGQNGESGQNSTSSSNQTETGVTQNGSQTSGESGQINSTGQVGQTTGQASGNGSNQESGEQNQTTSTQTNGEGQNNSTNTTQTNETANNTNGENGSNSSENGTENQTNNTENSTSSTNSSASNGGSNGGSNENPPDNSQNTTETTEDKKTNVLGGTVNSSQRSTESNKPQIVLSSDFAGFNFKDKEVSFGGKGTAGYTSMRWDGRRSYGVLLDYTSIIKGPNVTGFWANMAKRRIDLVSVTGTISFYGRGSQYGTLALGQMWSFPKVKNLKAIYLATGSFGNVYGEKFLGTAAIAGGMYDWKVSKRIDVKLMNLFIYAPYVSYYNDILLKSPYVIMPIIGTNIGITKKFKFNVNFGGAYAIKQNVMNFTLMFGTRLAI
jgi:hypothetical protein